MSLLFHHQFLGPLPDSGGNWGIERHANTPALLRYPSVPLPVFLNPFIPADWRRGGEHSCFPVGLSCVRGWGQGRGTSASVSAAVALIRDWPSKPVSCIVHQRRSASQPESQMIPSTCKAFQKKKKNKKNRKNKRTFQPPLSHIIL